MRAEHGVYGDPSDRTTARPQEWSKAVRFAENPIVKPADVSLGGEFVTVGTFNPGVATFEGQTLLLVRVAVRPVQHPGELAVPVSRDGKIGIMRLPTRDYDCADSRFVVGKDGRFLTSMSYFAVATSGDGVHFSVDPSRCMMPEGKDEEYGIEDPRITRLDDEWYITYTGVSEYGIVTNIRRTRDFRTFEKIGTILPPDNKDAAIFPERIGGRYHLLHRPSTSEFGKPEIWIASSDDLLRWGDHRRVAGIRKGEWDGFRIGSSSVPYKTNEGWLVLYHGADVRARYCLGAMLLDESDPSRVLARTPKPILSPVAPYEREGFFGNVVFACGCVVSGDVVTIYYGAADQTVCGATMSFGTLMEELQ